MAVNGVRLIFCMCNYASTYAITQMLMQMQIHESICKYMHIHVNVQALCKYMYYANTCTQHSMQICK